MLVIFGKVMFDKKKYKPQFPGRESFIHNHCNHPDINININNNEATVKGSFDGIVN